MELPRSSQGIACRERSEGAESWKPQSMALTCSSSRPPAQLLRRWIHRRRCNKGARRHAALFRRWRHHRLCPSARRLAVHRKLSLREQLGQEEKGLQISQPVGTGFKVGGGLIISTVSFYNNDCCMGLNLVVGHALVGAMTEHCGAAEHSRCARRLVDQANKVPRVKCSSFAGLASAELHQTLRTPLGAGDSSKRSAACTSATGATGEPGNRRLRDPGRTAPEIWQGHPRGAWLQRRLIRCDLKTQKRSYRVELVPSCFLCLWACLASGAYAFVPSVQVNAACCIHVFLLRAACCSCLSF